MDARLGVSIKDIVREVTPSRILMQELGHSVQGQGLGISCWHLFLSLNIFIVECQQKEIPDLVLQLTSFT